MNSSNLIPNTERTPEELREMGRRGGIASGKARRKKKKRQQEVRLFFQVFDEMEKQDPEKAKQILKGLPKREGSREKARRNHEKSLSFSVIL